MLDGVGDAEDLVFDGVEVVLEAGDVRVAAIDLVFEGVALREIGAVVEVVFGVRFRGIFAAVAGKGRGG